MPKPNEATKEALRQAEEGDLNERLGLGEILANLSEDERLQKIKEERQISEDISSRHSARRQSIRLFLESEFGAGWCKNPVRGTMPVYDMLRFFAHEEYASIDRWLHHDVQTFIVNQFHRAGLIHGMSEHLGSLTEKKLTTTGELLFEGLEATLERDGGELERLFNSDFRAFDRQVLARLAESGETTWRVSGVEGPGIPVGRTKLPAPGDEAAHRREEAVVFGEPVVAIFDHDNQKFVLEHGERVSPDFVPVWRYLNKR